jgi:hypothetical protein
MAANTNPIFSISGDITSDSVSAMSPTLTTAAADYTGISANNKLVLTVGANGGFVNKLRFKAIGTNVATVARVYFNNGSTNGTAANNGFFGEISLPATTASATAATIEVDYPINVALNGGFKIYVGLGTTVAAGWVVTGVNGHY